MITPDLGFNILGRPDDMNEEVAREVTGGIAVKDSSQEVPDYALLGKSKVPGVIRIKDIPLENIE